MSEKIGGKTFSTAEEVGITPPTEAELAHARRLFDEFQQQVQAVAAEKRPTEISPKFYDDVSGTE